MEATDTEDRIRIDKWLWHARFFKSRSLAADLIQNGRVRVNGQPVNRPSREIRPGDILTFPQGNMIRLIEVAAIGKRRGPATEASTLFTDLDIISSATSEPVEHRK